MRSLTQLPLSSTIKVDICYVPKDEGMTVSGFHLSPFSVWEFESIQGPIHSWSLSTWKQLKTTVAGRTVCSVKKYTFSSKLVSLMWLDIVCCWMRPYQWAVCWICGSVGWLFASPLHETWHLHRCCWRQRSITCLSEPFAKLTLSPSLSHTHTRMQKCTHRWQTCNFCHPGGMQSVTWPHHQAGG